MCKVVSPPVILFLYTLTKQVVSQGWRPASDHETISYTPLDATLVFQDLGGIITIIIISIIIITVIIIVIINVKIIKKLLQLIMLSINHKFEISMRHPWFTKR